MFTTLFLADGEEHSLVERVHHGPVVAAVAAGQVELLVNELEPVARDDVLQVLV